MTMRSESYLAAELSVVVEVAAQNGALIASGDDAVALQSDATGSRQQIACHMRRNGIRIVLFHFRRFALLRTFL